MLTFACLALLALISSSHAANVPLSYGKPRIDEMFGNDSRPLHTLPIGAQTWGAKLDPEISMTAIELIMHWV